MLCHVSAQLWVHICPVLQNVKCKRKWNQSTFGLWDRVFGYNQLTTLHNASRDVFRNLDTPFQDGSPFIPVETAFEIHEGFSSCGSVDAHLCFLHNYAVWTEYYNNTLCAVLLEFVAKIARRLDYA